MFNGHQHAPGQGHRQRPRRWPLVVLSLLVVVGLATPVLLLTRDGGSAAGAWDPRVADLAAYVEEARGLDFDHAVPVEFLTPDEYAAQTRVAETELTADERADLDHQTGFLRSLGLVSGDLDLFDAFNDMADAGTLAFYDPSTERVVVRGTEMTVNVRVTLVHELTHVLQDQHFDLEAAFDSDAGSPDGDDTARYEALTALVEGDAMRIELAYTRELPADERDEYLATYSEELAESEEGLAGVPAALVAFQTAPYALGEPLVEMIAARGGNSAVDRAFGRPPSTGEHVLDPRSYLANQAPTPLDDPLLPDGVADETDHGAMGSIDLYVILAERIDPIVALDAADGWGNGRYVSFERDGRACIRMALDGDTDADDQQLRTAFESWVTATPAEAGASVTDLGGGHTLVESCDPGAGVDASNERAMDVLTIPTARSQVALAGLVPGGTTATDADVESAWSTGDCFVRSLSLDQLMAANESTGTSPELQGTITSTLSECGL